MGRHSLSEGQEQSPSGARYFCPFPGCTRSFRNFWRLKVHYRAPPDIRGSGRERGHGRELPFCPLCQVSLKHVKYHRCVVDSRGNGLKEDAVPRDSHQDPLCCGEGSGGKDSCPPAVKPNSHSGGQADVRSSAVVSPNINATDAPGSSSRLPTSVATNNIGTGASVNLTIEPLQATLLNGPAVGPPGGQPGMAYAQWSAIASPDGTTMRGLENMGPNNVPVSPFAAFAYYPSPVPPSQDPAMIMTLHSARPQLMQPPGIHGSNEAVEQNMCSPAMMPFPMLPPQDDGSARPPCPPYWPLQQQTMDTSDNKPPNMFAGHIPNLPLYAAPPPQYRLETPGEASMAPAGAPPWYGGVPNVAYPAPLNPQMYRAHMQQLQEYYQNAAYSSLGGQVRPDQQQGLFPMPVHHPGAPNVVLPPGVPVPVNWQGVAVPPYGNMPGNVPPQMPINMSGSMPAPNSMQSPQPGSNPMVVDPQLLAPYMAMFGHWPPSMVPYFGNQPGQTSSAPNMGSDPMIQSTLNRGGMDSSGGP